jgi:hypothetical protein
MLLEDQDPKVAERPVAGGGVIPRIETRPSLGL